MAKTPEPRDATRPLPPAVILVRPREDGNVGAAARAMANMGLSELILVEPAVELGVLGHAFAKGAEHVVAGLVRVPSLAAAAAPFQRLVGTTSARDRSGGPEILRPRELAPRLAEDPPGTRTALVFGPEVSGLANDELALCRPLVNVPCDPVQPTLNLAQSVLVLAYELYLARIEAGEAEPATAAVERPPPAALGHVEGFFEQATALLRRVRFDRDDTFSTVLRDLRRLVARAAPSEREVTLLRGICRRVEYQLDRLDELRGAEPAPAGGEADDGSRPVRRPHRWSRAGGGREDE
jgi:tRNA (cytidine32/uridine32-2'-O)-methyltransferase